MLRQLRMFASSFVGGIVIILLALMFVPAGTQQQGSQSNLGSSVVTVDGERFYDIQVQQAANQILVRAGQTLEGNPRTLEEARTLEGWARIENQIKSQLASSPMLLTELERQGWTASRAEIIAGIPDDPRFQVAGQYARTLVEATLSTPEQTQAYINARRQEVNGERLLEFATNYAPDFTSTATAQVQFDRATRLYGLDSVTLLSNGEEVGEPTDAALQVLMDENPDAYQTEEYRSFSAIIIDPAAFNAPMAYAAYLETASADDSTKSFALINPLDSTEDQMQALAARINAGESFEAVGREVLGRAPETQSHTAATIAESLNDAVFGPGVDTGLVGPIQTATGWALLNITDVRDGILTDAQFFEQNPNLAISDQAMEQARQAATAMLDTQQNGVSAEGSQDIFDATLDDLSAAAGIDILTFGAMDRFGRYTDNAGVETLARQTPQLLNDLFALEQEGALSEVRINDDGTAFVIRLDGLTQRRPMSFEEATPRLTNLWRFNAQNDALQARLAPQLAALEEGSLSLEDFAAQEGTSVDNRAPQSLTDIARLNAQNPQGSISASMVTGMGIGDVEQIRQGARFSIFQLREIGQQTEEEASITLEQVQEGLSDDFASRLNFAFRQGLEENADIKVNDREFEESLNAAVVTANRNGYFDGTVTQASFQAALNQLQATASGSNGGHDGT